MNKRVLETPTDMAVVGAPLQLGGDSLVFIK